MGRKAFLKPPQQYIIAVNDLVSQNVHLDSESLVQGGVGVLECAFPKHSQETPLWVSRSPSDREPLCLLSLSSLSVRTERNSMLPTKVGRNGSNEILQGLSSQPASTLKEQKLRQMLGPECVGLRLRSSEGLDQVSVLSGGHELSEVRGDEKSRGTLSV